MNELIERLQKEISTWGGHLAPIEVLLKDSLDTLLALQTQLERVERETIERCAKLIESNVIRICEHEFGYNTKKGIAASIRALPSAKTATETE